MRNTRPCLFWSTNKSSCRPLWQILGSALQEPGWALEWLRTHSWALGPTSFSSSPTESSRGSDGRCCQPRGCRTAALGRCKASTGTYTQYPPWLGWNGCLCYLWFIIWAVSQHSATLPRRICQTLRELFRLAWTTSIFDFCKMGKTGPLSKNWELSIGLLSNTAIRYRAVDKE